MSDISAALLAPAGLVLVRNKAVHANTQEGSQASLLWIEFVEQLALEHFDKKALRQILRFVGGPVPAQANVFVDRLPVGGAKRFQRAFPLLRVNAAHRFDHRSPRRRKAVIAGLEAFYAHRDGSCR